MAEVLQRMQPDGPVQAIHQHEIVSESLSLEDSGAEFCHVQRNASTGVYSMEPLQHTSGNMGFQLYKTAAFPHLDAFQTSQNGCSSPSSQQSLQVEIPSPGDVSSMFPSNNCSPAMQRLPQFDATRRAFSPSSEPTSSCESSHQQADSVSTPHSSAMPPSRDPRAHISPLHAPASNANHKDRHHAAQPLSPAPHRNQYTATSLTPANATTVLGKPKEPASLPRPPSPSTTQILKFADLQRDGLTEKMSFPWQQLMQLSQRKQQQQQPPSMPGLQQLKHPPMHTPVNRRAAPPSTHSRVMNGMVGGTAAAPAGSNDSSMSLTESVSNASSMIELSDSWDGGQLPVPDLSSAMAGTPSSGKATTPLAVDGSWSMMRQQAWDEWTSLVNSGSLGGLVDSDAMLRRRLSFTPNQGAGNPRKRMHADTLNDIQEGTMDIRKRMRTLDDMEEMDMLAEFDTHFQPGVHTLSPGMSPHGRHAPPRGSPLAGPSSASCTYGAGPPNLLNLELRAELRRRVSAVLQTSTMTTSPSQASRVAPKSPWSEGAAPQSTPSATHMFNKWMGEGSDPVSDNITSRLPGARAPEPLLMDALLPSAVPAPHHRHSPSPTTSPVHSLLQPAPHVDGPPPIHRSTSLPTTFPSGRRYEQVSLVPTPRPGSSAAMHQLPAPQAPIPARTIVTSPFAMSSGAPQPTPPAQVPLNLPSALSAPPGLRIKPSLPRVRTSPMLQSSEDPLPQPSPPPPATEAGKPAAPVAAANLPDASFSLVTSGLTSALPTTHDTCFRLSSPSFSPTFSSSHFHSSPFFSPRHPSSPLFNSSYPPSTPFLTESINERIEPTEQCSDDCLPSTLLDVAPSSGKWASLAPGDYHFQGIAEDGTSDSELDEAITTRL